MKHLWLLALLLASPVYAQQSAMDTPPCVRGGSTIKLGGIDLDVLKCQPTVEAEIIANMALQMSELQARFRLMSQDLANSQKESEALKKSTPPSADSDNLRR